MAQREINQRANGISRAAIALSALAASLLSLSALAGESSDFTTANKLIHLPQLLSFTSRGTIDTDSSKWSTEKDVEGTDLYTAKTGDEAKAAAMKNSDGALEAFMSYTLKKENAEKEPKNPGGENSSAIFFSKGKLTAFTSCEDDNDKDPIGRICITATEKLCKGLRSGSGVTPEALTEVESFETRALAGILTLRGADHQLDNVVKSGNRLGLKSGLQTTKGQLMALARQVETELSTTKSAADSMVASKAGSLGASKSHKPASTEQVKKAVAAVTTENALAKRVVEKTFPRLKESCSVF
jgi:hypothetical protein